MTRPTILVTGGAGYIGAHACKALATAGWLPVAYDDLSQGHSSAVQWGPLERGEVADRERLDSVIRTYRPTAAMHFAACTSVAESIADPEKYHRTNVAATRTLIEALREAGIKRLVFSSSAAVYGAADQVPIPEDAPLAPINPYGQTKLLAERMLAESGLDATALRYFNAAGADPDGWIGEDHDPETHLIPLALAAASGKGPKLTVHGDDYPTADGTCIRDYVHVADLAEAHVRALDGGSGFGALNLGTGSGASVRQVLGAIERVTGRSVSCERGPRRVGDPPVLVADPSRALAELGWRPKSSDLDTIIASAWAWHQRT